MADMYPALHLIVQMDESPVASSQPIRDPTSNTWASAVFAPGSGSRAKSNEIPLQLASRITIETRTHASLQNVEGAEVYLLYLPSILSITPLRLLPEQITAELKAHLEILPASPRSRLILTIRRLPETDIEDLKAAGIARLQDLLLLQLFNNHKI